MKNGYKIIKALPAILPLASAAAATSATSTPAAASSCQRAAQPNIVFFLVDDYGWLDSEVQYGKQAYPRNGTFRTPNMLRLAEMGTTMTNAYATPVSSPTRCSLITGAHEARLRVTNFTSNTMFDVRSDCCAGEGLPDDNLSDPFAHPEWNWNGISPVPGIPHSFHATMLPQILSDNGYFTIHAGKAHWGTVSTPGANPLNMGYIVNIAGAQNGMPRSYQGTDNFGNTPELWNPTAVQGLASYYGQDINLTEALTREALRSLDYPIRHHIPFYLDLSHYGVHTPIQPDKRFYQKFIDMGYEEGAARYASMVESVDKSLGDVLDFLEKKGIADNTIVILYSDNGGHSIDTRKGGVAHHVNEPLREGKGSCYEGGCRVPMLVYWPGKTKAGSRIDTPVCCEDFFPSILEMAGIDSYETIQQLDGQSFASLVCTGCGPDPERAIIFHYPHQWRPVDLDDIDFLSSIREGRWKLVYRMHEARLELYDLEEDISESNDVAPAHSEIVARLAKDLSDRLRLWDASMPIVRSTGLSVPWPDEIPLGI